MNQVNDFERMIQESETYLIKFYFSINKREQAKRFEEINRRPLNKWKTTPVGERAQELWDEYTKYKKLMMATSDTKNAPWTVIEANKKTIARLEATRHILKTIPYKD